MVSIKERITGILKGLKCKGALAVAESQLSEWRCKESQTFAQSTFYGSGDAT
jgi:hypothetical protein